MCQWNQIKTINYIIKQYRAWFANTLIFKNSSYILTNRNQLYPAKMEQDDRR